jgi:hypothetical protein
VHRLQAAVAAAPVLVVQDLVDDDSPPARQADPPGTGVAHGHLDAGQVADLAHAVLVPGAEAGDQHGQGHGRSEDVLELEAGAPERGVVRLVGLERPPERVDRLVVDGQVHVLRMRVEAATEGRELRVEARGEQQARVPDRTRGEHQAPGPVRDHAPVDPDAGHGDPLGVLLHPRGLELRHQLEAALERAPEHRHRRALLAVDRTAGQADDAAVPVLEAAVPLRPLEGRAAVAVGLEAAAEHVGVPVPVRLGNGLDGDLVGDPVVPGVELGPREELHAGELPPVVEGDVVEPVEQRLVHDRAPAHHLGAQQHDGGVARELGSAAPEELRVRVELVSRVGVPREAPPRLEEQAAHAPLDERVRDPRAGDSGTDDDRVPDLAHRDLPGSSAAQSPSVARYPDPVGSTSLGKSENGNGASCSL